MAIVVSAVAPGLTSELYEGVSDRLCRHDENGGASCLRRSTRLSP
jgi:hypothetical protein